MRKFLPVLLIAMSLGLAHCGRQYAKGEYVDPNMIVLRSDKFVEADLQQIAQRLSESLLASAATGGRPAVILSAMTNETDEHIDMNALTDKIQVLLGKSGKVQLINAKMRPAVAEEYNYEASGFVDPATAKQKGKQLGAQYLISGRIAAIKQPVGRQEYVYYKAMLEMTNITTNVIAWTDDVEIKKHFRKKFTGF